jgi:hypothetical protein
MAGQLFDFVDCNRRECLAALFRQGLRIGVPQKTPEFDQEGWQDRSDKLDAKVAGRTIG